MFRVEAPFPLLQSTLLLPSPEKGNSRNLTSSVQTLRAMDGKVYTHIKSKRGRKSHHWSFFVARDKYLEAKAFAEQYATRLVRTVDHEGTVRVGWIVLNPVEFSGEGRAESWPGGEAYRFDLQLEEKV